MMVKKIFNLFSTITSVVAIILVQSFITITDSYYFNGYIVLIFLLILLNPISSVLSAYIFIQLDTFGLHL